MSCNKNLNNKKEFAINIYKELNSSYGQKNHYELLEIRSALKQLEYPSYWECWAFVAFMMPANVGEYLHSQGTPMDVVEMKKEFIKEMTDGKRDSLSIPSNVIKMYEDIEPNQLIKLLTHRSMTNYFAAHVGYSIGKDVGHTIINELMGE
jgi:hypothetical protein